MLSSRHRHRYSGVWHVLRITRQSRSPVSTVVETRKVPFSRLRRNRLKWTSVHRHTWRTAMTVYIPKYWKTKTSFVSRAGGRIAYAFPVQPTLIVRHIQNASPSPVNHTAHFAFLHSYSVGSVRPIRIPIAKHDKSRFFLFFFTFYRTRIHRFSTPTRVVYVSWQVWDSCVSARS